MVTRIESAESTAERAYRESLAEEIAWLDEHEGEIEDKDDDYLDYLADRHLEPGDARFYRPGR